MIRTKAQIIRQIYIDKGYKLNAYYMNKAICRHLRMSELEFIEDAKEQLNLNLEPIRKHTYICR